MNTMWAIIFFCLPLLGAGYALWHIWLLLPLPNVWRGVITGLLLLCFLTFFANFIFGLDRLPMALSEVLYEVGNSSIFILLYAVMLFLVLDLGRLLRLVPRSFLHHSWPGTLTVVILMAAIFTYGYFHYLHKVRQPITLKTEKPLSRPLKLVMVSDLHLGYHNRISEFRRWVKLLNAERPDLVLIGGDIIDGSMRAVTAQPFAAEFRKISAPVYACLGNHEYYAGRPEAQEFYRQAGIHLLLDSAVTVMGINVVGRDDRSNPQRKSLQTLLQGLDPHLYTLVMDHQPYHLEQAEQAGADFQLSGHTHYGQVWPISWIEDALYEDAFGPLRKGKTQYYVTSGIGIWGGKFRIGSRSEYVVATLEH